MNWRQTAVVILLIIGLGVGVWWGLPHLVAVMPSRVQARLPEEVIRLATTPLPTALPAPSITTSREPLVSDSVLLVPTWQPTPSPTPILPSTRSITVTPFADLPTVTPSPVPSSTPTPTAVAPSVLLEGMTITPQKLNNCGPTSLSINLQYYDLPNTQFDVADVVKPNYDDRNVSPQELVDYVNNYTDLRATLHSGGTLSLLKQLVAAGFPVVVEKGMLPSEWEGWMGHYLTFYGYDDATETFTSMDTFLGPWDGSGRLESYGTVAEFWQQFNYTFFVVYPPEREPDLQAILDATWRDPLLMWQRTAQQAQADIRQAPSNPYGWFNLGSSLVRLGALTGEMAYYEQAATAFDEARTIGLPWRMLWYQFEPYEAYLHNGRYEDIFTLTTATLSSEGGRNVEETYFYRGLAHQALGETDKAQADFARAQELNQTRIMELWDDWLANSDDSVIR